MLTDASMAGVDAIFVLALLTVTAITRWHFWWRTGAGRTRIVLLLSIAALTTVPALRHWTGVDNDYSSVPDYILIWTELAAITGVMISVAYMLCRVVAFNICRVRDPYAVIMQGRKHIERTPGASREEIEKLLACWDEAHNFQRDSIR